MAELPVCQNCGRDFVEDFGEFGISRQCGRCNDRDIERSNARREWDYWHNEPPSADPAAQHPSNENVADQPT